MLVEDDVKLQLSTRVRLKLEYSEPPKAWPFTHEVARVNAKQLTKVALRMIAVRSRGGEGRKEEGRGGISPLQP